MNRKSLQRGQLASAPLKKWFACSVIAALCLAGGALPAGAAADICINTYDWVTGKPTVEGRVDIDPGWVNAAGFNLGTDGGVGNPVKAQMIKDDATNEVYLSLDVRAFGVRNTDDVIVLAFGPDNNPDHDWRLHIFPFGASGETNQSVADAPFAVSAWRRNGTGWTNVMPQSNTDWPIANARIFKYPMSNNWSFEIKLKRASTATTSLADGIFFAADGVTTFKMYLNVLRTDGGLPGMSQAPWPHGVEVGTGGTVEDGTPPRTSWADVSLHSRSACRGVSVEQDDIGTTNPTNSEMRLHRPGGAPLTLGMCPAPTGRATETSVTNTFFASVKNTLPAAAPLNSVSMEYRIHDWGIPPLDPNLWSKIQGPVNPVTNSGPITTGGSLVTGLFNMNWAPTYEQSCHALATSTHECVLVIMTSPTGTVQLKNNGTRRNFDFVTTSLYQRRAKISARGYGPPPNGRSNHHFVLATQVEIEKCSGRQTTEEMTWTTRGYRETGNFIIIRGKKYPVYDEVGGFGYVGRHAGPVIEWRQGISGGGIKTIRDNLYSIDIPPEGEAIVDTFIESVDRKEDEHKPPETAEFKHWGLSLHAGVSIPHGDFNSTFNPGPNFAVDVEYRFNKTFSLEGIYGLHHFTEERIGIFSFGDLNVHQFSLNGKVYGNTSPVRPFFNFGGGAYNFATGTTTRGGINIGGGLQFDATPKVAIEGAYNFHNIFTSGSNTRFSTVQGGVRFRF
jgi:hypothetical protein